MDLHTDGLKGYERRELEKEERYLKQQAVLEQIEAHLGGLADASKAPPLADVLSQQTAMIGSQGIWTLNWPVAFQSISIGNTSTSSLTVIAGAPAGSGSPPAVGAGLVTVPPGVMRTVSLNGHAITVYGAQGTLFDITAYSRPKEPNSGPCVASPVTPLLVAWTNSEAYSVTSATRDGNEAIVTATVVWPDGGTGVFTTDTASVAFPGAIDAFHITYIKGPVSHTITQSLVTRDASGAVIAQPVPVVS